MNASPLPQCVWPLGAELGEGPLWSVDEKALWFVDIKQKKIHRFDPATGKGTSFDTPAPPGFLAHVKGGGLIVGMKTGLARFDPATGAIHSLRVVEPHKPGNRLNDGTVDPKGRLWFGSMDDSEEAPSGSLFCLDAQGLRARDPDYVITNGPAFSPDGRTLYHTDTLEKIIYAFDVDEAGEISNKRVFVRIEEGAGYPDGPTVDAEGCIWTGLFAGWSARRYSPEGEVLATVRFPCANVTKIAFGGPDLRDVYATTALKGLDARARAAQPLAGGLFRFRADVPGLKAHEAIDA
jgi:sugar lactone lactonase YvrE